MFVCKWRGEEVMRFGVCLACLQGGHLPAVLLLGESLQHSGRDL